MGWMLRRRASRLVTPALILQAGVDRLLMNSAQEEVRSRARHRRFMRFSEAMHEILMEKDAVRDRAVAETLRFFRSH